MEISSMLHLIFIAMFLFGSVIGWIVVYFVRKYKEYNPKVLKDTALLFLGGVCLDSLFAFMDKTIWITAVMSYIIGFASAFFIHWIYQLIVAKMMAPKFLDARSKYNLFSGCNLPSEEKNRNSQVVYLLECIGKGYEQLRRGLITEDEFKGLVKNSGLTNEVFKELTGGFWGDMFISPDLAAYIQAKNLFDEK